MWSSIVGFISEKPFTIWRNWLSNWDAWVVLKAKANTDWVMGCRWFCQKETEEQLWNLYNCTILFAACRKVHFPLCCQPLWLLNSRAVAYPAQNFTQWTKCQQNKLTFPTWCPIYCGSHFDKEEQWCYILLWLLVVVHIINGSQLFFLLLLLYIPPQCIRWAQRVWCSPQTPLYLFVS